MLRRFLLLLAVAAMPLALWGVLPLVSAGQDPDALQNRIDRAQDSIEWRRDRERALAADISGVTNQIDTLQADITVLQTRQVRLEGSLAAKRAELEQIQADLRAERLRLARLRARLAEARVALAERLVQIYKADQPDVVTVVLESDGFADLLERTEFMRRVSDQDGRILDRVRAAKAEAVATEARLDRLERRSQEVADAIAAEVQEVAAVKGQLVSQRDRYQAVRADKAEILRSTRADRAELESHVDALREEQEAVLAKIQAAQAARAAEQASSSATAAVAGPVRQGSGQFIWPADGAISSPFGMRWGRLHAGVDIPLTEGTGLRAAAGGEVIIAGWTGGYGNYTCIQHSGGLSTCYAHQSSLGVSVGQSVSQGQVIGASGNTGNSTGPHLHFEVRVNGSPVDPLGYL